ncbi:hypothetical protein AB6A40_002079 [Gnathostoma spinigerum]|uniref:TRAM domain-containing protein n=1 Tax=Gnathostoma spinigerum TaxID=75299 RepID=A0ABD6E6Q5_9BILA
MKKPLTPNDRSGEAMVDIYVETENHGETYGTSRDTGNGVSTIKVPVEIGDRERIGYAKVAYDEICRFEVAVLTNIAHKGDVGISTPTDPHEAETE